MSNFTTLVQVAGNTLAQLPKVPVVQEGAVPMVVTNKLYQPFADQVADLKSKNPTLPIYVKQLNGFIAKDGTFSFPDVTNSSGKFQLGNLINHLNSLAAIPTTLANENSEIKTNYTQASREAIKARLLFPLSCMFNEGILEQKNNKAENMLQVVTRIALKELTFFKGTQNKDIGIIEGEKISGWLKDYLLATQVLLERIGMQAANPDGFKSTEFSVKAPEQSVKPLYDYTKKRLAGYIQDLCEMLLSDDEVSKVMWKNLSPTQKLGLLEIIRTSEIEQKEKTDLIFKKLHAKAEDELLDFSRKVAGIREGRRELPPVGQERLDYNRDLQAWTKYWETIKGLVGQVEVKDIDLTPQKK